MNKKKLVYISHPSSGLEENTRKIEQYIRKLYQNDDIFDNFCIVSPVHCYGFMYHDTEYFKGLSFCTDLLMHCDIMLLCGDWKNSTGCTKERELCIKYNIPFIEIDSVGTLDKMLNNNLYEQMLKKINK